MSVYLEMWKKIHTLTPEQHTRWIAALEPAKGNTVDFEGVRVLDIDLLEALKNASGIRKLNIPYNE